MASAKGSQSSISYVKEVTWGTTPAIQFSRVTFDTDDMERDRAKQKPKHRSIDRQSTSLVTISEECSGGFNGELQAANLDGILPGFLMDSDWTVNVIQNGTTKSSYSIERAHNDIGQFIVYAGMTPAALELSIEAGEPITYNLSFVGKSETKAQATASTPAASAEPTKPFFTAGSSVGSIEIDDVAVASCLIQKIELTIDNQVEGKKAVGSLGFCDASEHSLSVTGSISMYFVDETYYDLLDGDTEFKLEIPMTDSLGNQYNIELPACQLTTGKSPITDRDGDVMAEHEFEAVEGAGGYTVKITRVVI